MADEKMNMKDIDEKADMQMTSDMNEVGLLGAMAEVPYSPISEEGGEETLFKDQSEEKIDSDLNSKDKPLIEPISDDEQLGSLERSIKCCPEEDEETLIPLSNSESNIKYSIESILNGQHASTVLNTDELISRDFNEISVSNETANDNPCAEVCDISNLAANYEVETQEESPKEDDSETSGIAANSQEIKCVSESPKHFDAIHASSTLEKLTALVENKADTILSEGKTESRCDTTEPEKEVPACKDIETTDSTRDKPENIDLISDSPQDKPENTDLISSSETKLELTESNELLPKEEEVTSIKISDDTDPLSKKNNTDLSNASADIKEIEGTADNTDNSPSSRNHKADLSNTSADIKENQGTADASNIPEDLEADDGQWSDKPVCDLKCYVYLKPLSLSNFQSSASPTVTRREGNFSWALAKCAVGLSRLPKHLTPDDINCSVSLTPPLKKNSPQIRSKPSPIKPAINSSRNRTTTIRSPSNSSQILSNPNKLPANSSRLRNSPIKPATNSSRNGNTTIKSPSNFSQIRNTPIKPPVSSSRLGKNPIKPAIKEKQLHQVETKKRSSGTTAEDLKAKKPRTTSTTPKRSSMNTGSRHSTRIRTPSVRNSFYE